MKRKNFTIDNTLDFSTLDLSAKSNVLNRYLNTIFQGDICNSILTLDVFHQDDSQSISLLYDYMMITDAVISHIEKEPDKFLLVDNLDSLDEFKNNVTSIILSYTNPAFLSSRPEIIRQMYRLGFRALTLKNNSEVGENNAVVINEEIISEANRLNMIINCSGFDHGLFDLSINSNLILSNIGCYSICPNPRNISDNSLEKVKERNNLISLSLDDFFLSKTYFGEVTKLREIAEWEIKYLEVEYTFDSPELELKKQEIYEKLKNNIMEMQSVDISFNDLLDHISHINKLIGTDNIHLASGLGEIIADNHTKYNNLDEIIDILIQKLLSAGFSSDDIENMLTGNMIKFITRNKH